MKTKIKMYSTQTCPYCVRAKALFASKGVAFEEIDLTNNFDEIDKIKALTGHKTIPIIFVNDVLVGGYDNLVEKLNKGEIVLN